MPLDLEVPYVPTEEVVPALDHAVGQIVDDDK